MELPFISDLSDKTLEELQTTINDLNKKLNFVYKTQNGAMIHQIRMLIDSYRVEYGKRMDELYKKQNLSNKINISKETE